MMFVLITVYLISCCSGSDVTNTDVIATITDQVVKQVQHQLLDINSKLEQLTEKLRLLQDSVYDVSSQNANLQHQLDTLWIDERTGQVSGNCDINRLGLSFSTFINASTIIYPEQGETIPFHGVLLNKGGAYDVSASTFTCPVSGIYVFMFTVYSGLLYPTYRTSATLFIDDLDISMSHCTVWEPGTIALQCGNSAIVQCKAGQRVRLVSEVDNNVIYGSTIQRRNTFSGFLFHADRRPF